MLYTNELSLYVPDCVTVVQFADDTQLLISGKKSDLPRIIRIMEETLVTIYQWFCANSMKSQARNPSYDKKYATCLHQLLW